MRIDEITFYQAMGSFIIEWPEANWSEYSFPTSEAAKAHVDKLNAWLATRPDPNIIEPFNAEGNGHKESTAESFYNIIEQMHKPEQLLDELAKKVDHECRTSIIN